MKAKINLLLLSLIFYCLTVLIICDNACDSITCEVDVDHPYQCTPNEVVDNCICKFKYPNSCHKCETDTSGIEYYTIHDNGLCSNTCTGNKIIQDTGECTSMDLLGTGIFYKFGDFYFLSAPSDDDSNIVCFDSHICKCKKYFYTEYIQGKKKYTCFDESNNSGADLTQYKYYNYNTNEFFKDECPDGYKFEKEHQFNGNNVIRCTDSCFNQEFYILSDGNNKCYEACPTNPPNLRYHNYGSKECINDCLNEYKYKDEDNDKYICYKKEECAFIDEVSHICYHTSCPSSGNTFHNFDSNICIGSCSNDRLYYISGGTICYPSCKDIPNGNYIYEDKINNICYDSEPTDCEHYYKKVDGVLKCTTQSDCITKNYKYFIGKECRDNCDGYYKLEEVGINYITCFDSITNALSKSNVNYYNLKSKLLWNTAFPDAYYINKKHNIVNEGTTSTVEKYEIVEECENYYYEDNSKKYCTNDCTKDINNLVIDKYFVKGNKKCESSCINFNPKKYYYDPDSHECLDTCEGRSKRFQNPQDSTHALECLSSCT